MIDTALKRLGDYTVRVFIIDDNKLACTISAYISTPFFNEFCVFLPAAKQQTYYYESYSYQPQQRSIRAVGNP